VENLIEDVSTASAAYLLNVGLPEILKLPASEQYKRLQAHFEACLMAFLDGQRNWLEPSQN
jgi:hypothetical protein